MIHQTLSGPLLRSAGVPSDEDVRLINSLGNPPPVPVSERDIYVRRCRLAGDAVDAYHGCFRTTDLPRLLGLIQGSPLLVGHDKRSLGVARFFGGTIEQQTEHHYIVPHFYWLRGHSAAEDLRVAIDGGLYSEASISFCYETPTCSVCGKDIRTCEHLTGSLGPNGAIFYYYDNVLAVLEGSLVYRGAEPGTGFSLGRGILPTLRTPHDAIGGTQGDDTAFGIPTLRVKRHGKWYRAPLIEEVK